MATKQKPEFQFDLTGGQLALDFANTVSRRDDPARRKDHLESYDNLVSFARQTELVSPKQSDELLAYALHHSDEGRRSYTRAMTLREAIFRTFSAIAKGKPVDPRDLQTINDYSIEALQHRRLMPTNGSYVWDWRPDARNRLDRVVWPVAQSAADLLTTDELQIVRFCEAPDCEWLFLDHSRNRSRRWCDMKTCGNREKARRHYRRSHD